MQNQKKLWAVPNDESALRLISTIIMNVDKDRMPAKKTGHKVAK